jgi:hypothetical protein
VTKLFALLNAFVARNNRFRVALRLLCRAYEFGAEIGFG